MKKITIREIAELGLVCGLMVGGKEALRNIPNVHPVTLLLIFAVIRYQWKAYLPMLAFVILELCIYGLGMWSLTYLFVWPVLTTVFFFFRKKKDKMTWAVLAGLSGLFFGAFCEIPFIFTIGLPAAFTAWISGIPYDLIHCVSNFLLVYFLLEPILKVTKSFNQT